MPALDIHLDGTGMLKDIPADKLVQSKNDIMIGVLEGGMTSGLPSVGIAIKVGDTTVFGETSMKLFLLAALALYARHGDAGTGVEIVVKQ